MTDSARTETQDSAPNVAAAKRRISMFTRVGIGLFVIAALLVFGELYHARMVRAQQESARLRHVAEQQRTLSQRLVNAALLAVEASTPEQERQAFGKLRESLRQWQAGRRELLEGASGVSLDAPAVRQRLLDAGPDAEAMSQAALRLVSALDSEPARPRDRTAHDVQRLMELEDNFFGAMEEVTLALVDDYDFKVAQLLERDRVRLYIILATLVLEALLVVVPATAFTRAAFANLRKTNVALDAALADARTAAQSKADFLATTSHELRTPLNAVIGLSGLLQRSGLDERQRQFVETINYSGEHLLQLINDILDLSKMDAGKLALENVEFDVVEVVEASVEALALRAESKHIDVVAIVSPDVPRWVRGDAGRVRQVLLNLLSNAVKFTEAGHVIVRVGVQLAAHHPPQVHFEIEDTGPGIPPDVQRRLFQPFTQADATTTRRFGGTGLGLSISRRLVELMGGAIHLSSKVGAGSVFSFELPLPAVVRDGATDESASAVLAGRRTLIVDDVPANRLVLHGMLTEWGAAIGEAASGPAALEELARAADRGAPYELAILDWHMPEVDGFMLASAIRNDPRFRGIKLVLLSSFSRGRDDAQAQAGGFDAGLVKPVRRYALQRALCDLYETRATPHTPGDTPELPQFPNARVLVADDNPVNVLVARAMLEQMGISAEAAGTGVEALAAVDRTAFDLVLMDVEMPDLDGRDATRELRRRESGTGRHLPVVAVTASAMQEDRALCLRAGMDDYVSKPISLDVLVGTVTRWLSPATSASR